jgi:acyl-coenzyme A synthetase/AMP-(fatty) acid ligase
MPRRAHMLACLKRAGNCWLTVVTGFKATGVQPVLVDEHGRELPARGEAEGNLLIRADWPAILRTVYGAHQRYEETYFAPYPGYFFTGEREAFKLMGKRRRQRCNG